MKSTLIVKLILIGSVFLIYVVGFGVFFIQNLGLQAVALIAIQIMALGILGGRKYLSQYKLILPFAGSLLVMYTLFIFLGISPQGTKAFEYWLAYGLPRIILLIGTIMLFRICIEMFRYQDFFVMGMDIHVVKYLILGRILYLDALNSYRQMREWQDLIPSQQIGKQSLKRKFLDGLSASLALTLFVLADAKLKGELIDNRILLCYKEK